MDHTAHVTSAVTESHSSTNPKLDYILSVLRDQAARNALKAHGISDLWLPIPKQIVRRLLADSEKEKIFLIAQNAILDDKIAITDGSTMHLTTSLGHFSIEDDEELVREFKVLGEGAYGTVEEVTVTTPKGTFVCVRKRIGRPKQLKAQKAILTAFARELKVMRQVQHRHCVRIRGSYTDLDHVNILSSPVADMDLAIFLDLPITEERRKVLYRGVGCLCNAIKYLHQNHIRHEDLKPQNILIHGDNIMLTDFGFSLDFSNDSVSTTTGRPSAWTIRYSAPEVLDFEPRNRATDIYSLGCVLLEMVSAFHGTNLADLKSYWRSSGNGQSSFARNPDAAQAWIQDLLHKIPRGVHPESSPRLRYLCRLISVMLSTDRNHRPTADQIVNCLSDIMGFIQDSDSFQVAACKDCPGDLPHLPAWRYLLPIISSKSEFYKLGMYLYPWDCERMDYWLLDLDWHMIREADGDDQRWSPIKHHLEIQNTGNAVYEQASRNGVAQHIWDAHQRLGKRVISGEGVQEAWISAQIAHHGDIAFRDLSIVPWDQDSDSHSVTRVHVQVTLLPISLPKASYYGSLFWMVSWPKTEGDLGNYGGFVGI
jgi:serine/threonine protein kinase